MFCIFTVCAIYYDNRFIGQHLSWTNSNMKHMNICCSAIHWRFGMKNIYGIRIHTIKIWDFVLFVYVHICVILHMHFISIWAQEEAGTCFQKTRHCTIRYQIAAWKATYLFYIVDFKATGFAILNMLYLRHPVSYYDSLHIILRMLLLEPIHLHLGLSLFI